MEFLDVEAKVHCGGGGLQPKCVFSREGVLNAFLDKTASRLVHARIGSIVGNAKLETGVFAAAKGPPTSTPPQPLMPHAPHPLS